ncbi:MAG TPA: hypothetical protein PLO41_06890 [Rubrivivax sp.]|nr:hypothetical protein [Rubrivivax sp.]
MSALPRTLRRLCCAAAGLCLAACGGGEVGGTLSGLGDARSVTLLNNDRDALTLVRNGSFTFADTLAANAAYAVTVQTQPVGQSCSVAGGSGTIDADGNSIDSVRVSCAFVATLRGTVSGLLPGAAVTLGDGSHRVAVSSDGPFAFAPTLADGTRYEVSVLTQPIGGNCIVPNGSGTFVAASFDEIRVVCS